MTVLVSRSCPTCRSIGAPRLIVHDGQGAFPCPDAWHGTDPTEALPLPDRIAARTAALADSAADIAGRIRALGIYDEPRTDGDERGLTATILDANPAPAGALGYPKLTWRAYEVKPGTPDPDAETPGVMLPPGWTVIAEDPSADTEDSVVVWLAVEHAVSPDGGDIPEEVAHYIAETLDHRDDTGPRRIIEQLRAEVADIRPALQQRAAELDQTRAVLAEVLDPRRWSPAAMYVGERVQDGARLEATSAELADWRARAAGQPARIPASGSDW